MLTWIHPSLWTRLALTCIVGVCLVIISAVSLYLFVYESEWFTFAGPYGGKWHGYTKVGFTGLVFFTFCTVPGITVLYTMLRAVRIYLTSCGKPLSEIRLPIIFAAIGFFTIGMVGIGWANEMLRCGVIFCSVERVAPEIPNMRAEAGLGWIACVGIKALVAGLGLSCALVAAIAYEALTDHREKKIRSLNNNSSFHSSRRESTSFTATAKEQEDTIEPPVVPHRLLLPPTPLYSIISGASALLSIAFFAYLAMTIPNSWEYFSAPRLAAYLAQTMFSAKTCPKEMGGSCPELPDAWFVTTHWVIKKDVVVLKVFPSTRFFYTYLLIVVALAVVTYNIQVSRKILTRRLPYCSCFPLVGRFFLRTTVGEVLITVLTTKMIILWSMYWLQSHNFNGGWSPSMGKNIGIKPSERWARGSGQIALLAFSLLLFPASRNSVIHKILGTSWESWIWAHKALGYLMLAATLAHIVAWYVRYDQGGFFPTDILSVPMTLPTSIDNFTVPLITLTTFFMLVAIGLGALEPVRRRYFELFYYLHLLAAYSSIPAVLWHAAAGWEYMLPGLTVWFMDRVIRFFRSGCPAILEGIEITQDPSDPSQGVLELRFRPAYPISVCAGQYVFLNIPEISLLEWHPFTISSSGSRSPYLSVHIKVMGEETWTQRVFLYALHCKSAASTVDGQELEKVLLQRSFQLYVDGPYGQPLNAVDYKHLVLVAGGIGITPCVSLLNAVRECNSSPPSSASAQVAVPSENTGHMATVEGGRINNSGTPFGRSELLLGSNEQPLLQQQEFRNNGLTCNIQRVTLLWSVRDQYLMNSVAEAFHGGMMTSYSAIYSEVLKVFKTGVSAQARRRTGSTYSDAETEENACPLKGFQMIEGTRPNYKEELASVMGNISFDDTLVMACGPHSLVDSALFAASQLGCHFRHETFEL